MRKMKSFQLTAVFILSAFLLITCGDDPPNGPDPLPTGLIAINGLYYKGAMGDSAYHKSPEFAVTDNAGKYLPNKQIQVELISGDGTLAPKSIVTDSTGIAKLPYIFSGSLGHAIVRLTVPGTDTLDVYLRAEVLIPGEHGQGQYVLLDDILEDVKNLNGQPERVEEHPLEWLNYVLYETTLGVVVVIDDTNQDRLANDNEDVKGVILNTVFEGKTLTTPPIGIGSSWHDVINAFPDTTADSLVDLGDSLFWVLVYDSAFSKTVFWHTYEDSIVDEIHIEKIDTFTTQSSSLNWRINQDDIIRSKRHSSSK